jgi:hypothetical protein
MVQDTGRHKQDKECIESNGTNAWDGRGPWECGALYQRSLHTRPPRCFEAGMNNESSWHLDETDASPGNVCSQRAVARPESEADSRRVRQFNSCLRHFRAIGNDFAIRCQRIIDALSLVADVGNRSRRSPGGADVLASAR